MMDHSYPCCVSIAVWLPRRVRVSHFNSTLKDIPMTKLLPVVLCLGLFSVGHVFAQEANDAKPPAPLSRAKVGDYVVFKLVGPQVQGTMRQEVVAVTDKNVTIKTTSTTNGFTLPASEQTVDIKVNYFPAVEAKNRKDNQIVDTGAGTETLTINGKAYKCDWRSNSSTTDQGGVKIVSESKVWTSADAPVYGLVKTETKVFGQTTIMELSEAGAKP